MKKKVLFFGKKVFSKIYLFVLLFFLITTGSAARNSSIKGTVIDAQNSEPLIGAAVAVTGTTQGGATDLDGNYTIPNLTPGTYSLTISYISYKTQTQTDVKVNVESETIIDIKLEAADISLKEVQVVARANRESENILLLEQRQAVLATQAVGAHEMSRKGLGDAESAVTNVSGISKQEGVKNVFVRGLGDRYNATYLNGFPIPSEDPEYKNITLDFFGTDVIQHIGVNKVFNASLPGDVGGAVIDISSKELVGRSSLSIDASAGANFSAVQNPYFVQDGYTYLGFADRSQPKYGTFDFKNSLDPYQITPVNHSFGVAGGYSFKMGDNANPLSFYMVASHSKSYSAVLDEIVRNITPDGLLWHDQKSKRYNNTTNQLALANVQYEFSKHRLGYNFMLVHAENQYVGEYLGKNSERHQDTQDDSYWGYLRRQQTNGNLLIINQLTSDWKLSDLWKFQAGVSYNNVTGSEPDRRENYLTRNAAGTYGFTGSDRQKRFFSILTEDDVNLKLNLIYKLTDKVEKGNSNIRFGYIGRYIDDNFNATEYVFSRMPGVFEADKLQLDEAYNTQNFNKGDFAFRKGYNNRYRVAKFINSPFIEATYQFTPNFIANTGLKADLVMMDLDYNIEVANPGSVGFTKFYPLPSVNLKYDLSDEQALRLGLSKTYTLPQSKEISPYEYININFVSKGDKEIQPSENYNVDLKWDYYLSPSELISVTGFYKHILRPIGRVDAANSAGQLIYKNIADFASVAGAELEIRKNIINIVSGKKTNRLAAGFSASYIYSNLLLDIINTTPRNVQLEGASPFIVNFDLSYYSDFNEINLVNSVVFNYFSDRIHTIGAQSFTQNLMEKGVPALDFVSAAKISKSLTIKLKASNLLNSPYRLTRKNNAGTERFILSEFRKGTSISLGLTYDL